MSYNFFQKGWYVTKPKLILISHGHFAEEARRSAEMIMGSIDGLYTVAMLADDGLEGTAKKLNAVLDEIGKETGVVVLADMMAGTPCNVAVRTAFERKDLRVVAGLNLPMVLEYAVAEEDGPEAMADYLQRIGNEAVQRVQPKAPSKNESGEGYED